MNIEALFTISYGLYIVCSKAGGRRSGFIANSVFQVTAEPPRFAVCCNKDNFTAELIKESKSFSLSVLQKDASLKLIGAFGYKSGKDTDKLHDVNYFDGETGVPVVTQDCVAWFECELVDTFEVGTHYIFIGLLKASDTTGLNAEPLGYSYYRETRKGVAPKNAPTYIDKSKLASAKPKPVEFKKYECQVCGYIYDQSKGDPDGGIAPGTPFEAIPDDWVCPVCGTRKSDFLITMI